LVEDHCNVREDGADRLVAAPRQGHAVVGGSIHNAADRRVRDWAAFLCEYSSYLPSGQAAGAVYDLPGMNVSYDRKAIAAIEDLLREGRWEGWVHARRPQRANAGAQLSHSPPTNLAHESDAHGTCPP